VTDRAAAVRHAMRALVARRGFHGASMSAVAAEAGVATGTAYVHYASKDDLVLATYREVKRDLGVAATAGLDRTASPHDRFVALWLAIYRHLAAEPDRARFLVQVESSPYAQPAHAQGLATQDDTLMAAAAAPDLAERLAPLPAEVLFDLGIAPAVRLVASGRPLDDAALEAVAEACWRAVTQQP